MSRRNFQKYTFEKRERAKESKILLLFLILFFGGCAWYFSSDDLISLKQTSAEKDTLEAKSIYYNAPNLVPPGKVEIYSVYNTKCGACFLTRKNLEKEKIPFREFFIDLDSSADKKLRLMMSMHDPNFNPDVLKLPVILAGDKMKIGYSTAQQVQDMLNSRK